MKYILTLCLLLSTMMTYAQTSPSTGSCPADGCNEDYSASYLDPATTVSNGSLGDGNPSSFFQLFGSTPLATEITCICFDVNGSSANPNIIITINVYSYDSASPFTIANIGTPIGTVSYTYTGAEVNDQTICLNIIPTMGVSLAPGDDTFVIEYFDPSGISGPGMLTNSPFGGNVTYNYQPALGDIDPILFSGFGIPSDMILEINGCVPSPCEAEGGSFGNN